MRCWRHYDLTQVRESSRSYSIYMSKQSNADLVALAARWGMSRSVTIAKAVKHALKEAVAYDFADND